jgi:hypothetical protein
MKRFELGFDGVTYLVGRISYFQSTQNLPNTYNTGIRAGFNEVKFMNRKESLFSTENLCSLVSYAVLQLENNESAV